MLAKATDNVKIKQVGIDIDGVSNVRSNRYAISYTWNYSWQLTI